jgi:hypothetical protein
VSDGPVVTDQKRADRAEREARLAQALRDNLRRRKEQQRVRDKSREAAGEDRAGLSPDPRFSKSTRHGGRSAD